VLKTELRSSTQELEKTREAYNNLKVRSEKESPNNLGKIKIKI